MCAMKKEVVPYDPFWPKAFEAAAKKVQNLLGNHCLHMHHMGSTAIPGLCAKNQIDTLCVVDDLKASLQLQDHGYTFKGELNVPLRYFFSSTHTSPQVNIHVVQPGHGFIDLNLTFRDYLRSHEEDRISYGNLKEQLLLDPKSHERQAGRFTGYTLGKDQFIKNLLDKGGLKGRCLNFCMHTREWAEYHRIRKELIFDHSHISYDENHPSLTDPKHFHFVLYQGITIVATAHMEFLNEKEAALRTLATDMPYQHQRHGTYLMKQLEQWVALHDRHIIKTHARPESASFYEKLGYVDMPFEDTSIQKNCRDMGKVLPPSSSHPEQTQKR